MQKYGLFLTVLLSFLAGCTKSGDGGSKPSEPIHIPGQKYQAKAASLEGRYFWDRCDVLYSSKRMEIAKALDEHKWVIDQFRTDVATNPGKHVVVDSGFVFTKERDPVPVSIKTFTNSWADTVKYYPTALESNDPEDWFNLQSEYDYMLDEDQARLVFNMNMQLGRENLPKFEHLYKGVTKNCNAGNFATCLTSADYEYIQSNIEFKVWWQFVVDAVESADRIKQWQGFIDNLNVIYDETLGFYKNDRIRREGPNLIVTMNTKDFAPIRSQIQAIIEKYWKSPTQKVIIEWTEGPAAVVIHRLPNFGERSHVKFADREMWVSEGSNLKVFVHEFGHVLGFQDQYITTWDSQNCAYTTDMEMGNIISDTETGVPLQKHWDKLNEMYPN